jgi:actin-like ATPase involved in cell morphogenesis
MSKENKEAEAQAKEVDEGLSEVEKIDSAIDMVEGKEKFKPGVGVDVGTSNIVVARQAEDGTFVNRYHRDMLYPLDVSDESADLLERSDYLFVKVDGKYFVVGEDALKLVNAIGRGEVVRPMKDGILNPSLKESSELLFYIIKAVVGDPVIENEPLRFSVPANPVDRDLDNLFHQMILTNFFARMGYDAQPVNEAMCICYDCNPVMKSDEGSTPLSGIACSFGGGMCNIALSYKGLSLVEFSCTKSGDNIDEQASKVTGMPKGKVLKAKEKRLDLDNPDMSDRVLSALSIYYDEMMDRMVHHIANEFRDKNSEMDGDIEIVVAGGTSMPKGFCNRLKKAFERVDMPFSVYDVRHSETPFYSVSQGACIRAQADYQKKNK